MRQPVPFNSRPPDAPRKSGKGTVRRYVPRRRVVFDEQQWPVNIVLVVLGGFLIGGIFAYQRFDDPRWYASPWLSLTLVVLLIGTTIMTLRMIDNRKFKRTMQFSVVVCAIIHLGMLIYSVESMIFSKAWQSEVTQKQLVRKQPRKQMEYHPTPEKQAEKPDFLKPIDTEVPEPTPPEVERQQQREPETPQPVEQPPVPEPEKQPQPEVMRKQSTTESSQARQSATTSRLTKRDVQMPDVPKVTADVAQRTVQTNSQPQENAPSRQVRRSQPAEVPQKVTVPKIADAPAMAQANNVQRADNAQAANTNNASQATTVRQTVENAELPKTQVVPVPQQQTESKVSSKPIEVPRNTVARQQQTVNQVVPPQPAPPLPEVPAVSSTQPVQRQSPSERKNVLAQNPSPRSAVRPQTTPSVDPVVTPRPTPTAVTSASQPAPAAAVQRATKTTQPPTPNPPAPRAPANPVRVAAQTAPRAVTSPSPSNPQSQAARSATVARNRRADASVPNPTTTATAEQRPEQQAVAAKTPNAAPGAVARANTNRPSQRPQKLASVENQPQAEANTGTTIAQRRESASQVSATNENRNLPSPQRSSQVASSTASPVNADVPANARAVAANNTPSLESSRRATAKAEQGESGARTGQNLAAASAAAESTSQVAATAATRAEATRNMAATANASSAVAQVQRNRTQADVASAIHAPNTKAVTERVASRQPAEQTLDASAATQPAAATTAVASSQNAAVGSASADTGEPAVRAAEQFSRAAGGGQKQLSNETDNSEVARTVTGQNFEALASNTTAELAQSVEGSAGQPAAAALTANNQSAARAESGAQQSLVGDRAENQSEQDQGQPEAQIAQNDLKRNEASRSGPAGDASALDEEMMSTAAVAGSSAMQRETAALNSTDSGTVAAVSVPGEAATNPDPAGADTALAANASTAVQRADSATDNATANAPPGALADATGQPVSAMEATRAESADAPNGDVVLGGGTASPQRQSQGPPVSAVVAAPVAMVAGAAESAGSEQGVPVAAQGEAVDKIAGGIRSPATSADVGAAVGDVVAQGETSIQGEAVGNRREQSNAAVGDSQEAGSKQGSALSRTQTGGALAGDFGPVEVDVPQTGISTPGEVVQDAPGGDYTVGPVAQTFAEAAPVKVDAEDGLGGLGEKIATDIGVADRRASSDQATIQLQSSRFKRDSLAGLPALDVHATMAKKSFDGRMNREGGGNGTAGPETEEAIERGLAFLARFQKRDGSWSLQQFAVIDGVSAIDSDTAATALAMLAFQGAGYNHQEHQYKEVVAAALNFIVTHQTESGDYYLPQGTAENRVARLYGHAIATLAMCEAYGMTQDPNIKDSVQQALNFIVSAQHEERGGWRYTPGRESDTSVSGWMLMALESGRRAGLEVPAETFDGVRNWLDTSQDKDQPFLYSYNPYAPVNSRQGQGRMASKTMTSVGLLMRLYLGWSKDDENSVAGAHYLEENLPSIRKTKDASLRDTYYWYYATQFMYHMGGEHWKKWNDRLHPLLVNGQELKGELAGSWDPRQPVPDRWGPHAGRLYVTAMNLLSLEVHYRHLPLYSDEE